MGYSSQHYDVGSAILLLLKVEREKSNKKVVTFNNSNKASVT